VAAASASRMASDERGPCCWLDAWRGASPAPRSVRILTVHRGCATPLSCSRLVRPSTRRWFPSGTDLRQCASRSASPEPFQRPHRYRSGGDRGILR
jgi:hypothetical protein